MENLIEMQKLNVGLAFAATQERSDATAFLPLKFKFSNMDRELLCKLLQLGNVRKRLPFGAGHCLFSVSTPIGNSKMNVDNFFLNKMIDT